MKKHLIILLLVLIPSVMFSQQIVWTEKVSGVTTALYGASEGQYSYGDFWVCGANGVVLKTSNLGNNWVLRNSGLPSNITFVSISNARVIPDDIVLVAGNIGTTTYVYRTSNGGLSWSLVFTQLNGKINSVKVWNGFMAGNPVSGRWSLWKTTNTGTTWDSTGLYLPQSGNEAGWANSLEIVQCESPTTYWMGTNNYRIYRSTNYGINWAAISTGGEQNSSAICISINIPGQGHGYAGGSHLIRTTSCGSIWDTSSAPGSGNFGGITFGYPGVYNIPSFEFFGIFTVRNNNKIYYTEPNSSTWNEYTAPAGTYTYINSGVSGGPFVAVRDNGGISWFCCFYGGVQQIKNAIPDKFSLSQNYPNPFNPITIIKYQIAKPGIAKLVVYDVLGQEVSVLINEKQSPGTYEADWDGSNYSSGVYFYKLITAGYTETRKMVLVK
jgi:Secretion system C-terminal sorting domain